MNDKYLEEKLKYLRDQVDVRRLRLVDASLGSKESGVSWNSYGDALELIDSAADLLKAGWLTAPAAYVLAEQKLSAAGELTQMQEERVSKAERRSQQRVQAEIYRAPERRDAEPPLPSNRYSMVAEEIERDIRWAKTHWKMPDEGWG